MSIGLHQILQSHGPEVLRRAMEEGLKQQTFGSLVCGEISPTRVELSAGGAMKTDKRGMLWVDGVGDRRCQAILAQHFLGKRGMATKQEETASGRRGARLQRAERRQIADHGAPMTSKNTK